MAGGDSQDINTLFEFNVSEPEKKERSGKLDLGYWTYHVYTKEFNKRKTLPKKPSSVPLGQKFKELSFSVTKSFSKEQPPVRSMATSSASDGQEATERPVLGRQWEETKTYIDQLERSLSLLKERIELLVKRRRETSASLLEFGKSFVKVGEIESSYEDGSLPKALIDVGHHSEHLSIVYQEQAENETIQVIETISYYDVIKRIQKMVLTHDTIDDSLTKMQEKKSKFQGKEEDQRRLELEINNATERKREAAKEVMEAESTLTEEMKRFHREKQYDIKQMLKAFVDLQQEYAGKMKTSWEAVLPSVEAIKTD